MTVHRFSPAARAGGARTASAGRGQQARVGLLAVLLAGGACEAGPPAFDGPEDAPAATASGAGVDSSSASTGSELTSDGAGADTARVVPEGARPSQSSPTSPSDTEAYATGPDAAAANAVPAAESGAGGTRPDVTSWGPGASARVESWGTERFPYPDAMRGVYLNAWAAGSSTRIEQLIDLARRTEINTFVIDIKDASGYVSHRTEVPLAHEIGATGEVRIRDLPGLLARLEAEGIYPVARIVIVKDPLLVAAHPELAVQDTAGGVWVDGSGALWLNPYETAVWEYHMDIAREVAELGFPEIQWDYVRFPDAPRSHLARAVFPGNNGRSKPRAIRDFLRHSREELAELGVLVTADVFGVTTTSASDVGIGQVWEAFIDVVDAALPMVYPSHYWRGSFGIQTPNAYPYEIVYRALRDAERRSEVVEGAGLTRPYLQDFTLGQPRYEAPEVRAQIQATYDAGVEEWVLWNPGSRYTEEALQPADGWDGEPLIRVAGGIHPVSRREIAIDSVRTAAAAAERRAAFLQDSLAGVADSMSAEPIPGARPVMRPDTVGPRTDTTNAEGSTVAPAIPAVVSFRAQRDAGLHPGGSPGR